MNDFNKKADPELIIVIVLILVVMGVYYFYLYREYDKNRKKLQEKKSTGQCPDYWRVLTKYSSSPAATSGCENTQRIGRCHVGANRVMDFSDELYTNRETGDIAKCRWSKHCKAPWQGIDTLCA